MECVGELLGSRSRVCLNPKGFEIVCSRGPSTCKHAWSSGLNVIVVTQYAASKYQMHLCPLGAKYIAERSNAFVFGYMGYKAMSLHCTYHQLGVIDSHISMSCLLTHGIRQYKQNVFIAT